MHGYNQLTAAQSLYQPPSLSVSYTVEFVLPWHPLLERAHRAAKEWDTFAGVIEHPRWLTCTIHPRVIMLIKMLAALSLLHKTVDTLMPYSNVCLYRCYKKKNKITKKTKQNKTNKPVTCYHFSQVFFFFFSVLIAHSVYGGIWQWKHHIFNAKHICWQMERQAKASFAETNVCHLYLCNSRCSCEYRVSDWHLGC